MPALSTAVILVFMLGVGGSWTGITQLIAMTVSLLLIGCMVIAWLYSRGRFHARWHSTPVDLAMPLWFAAFAISTLANWTLRSNIAIGLWFAGLYILAWYVIFDSLSNRLVSVETLLRGFSMAGIVVVLSAAYQFVTQRYPDRISGILVNPNIFAAFLILLLPITIRQVLRSKGYVRLGYAAFLLSQVVVLLLSGSRGGILGVCCSLGVIFFYKTSSRWRLLAIVCAGLILVVTLIAIRGDNGRYPIYEQAFVQLMSSGLTGSGLFTFRTDVIIHFKYHLPIQPTGQNLHSYNVLLQVAVELGVMGVLAFAVSTLQCVRKFLQANQQLYCVAAVVGLFAQQMVDFTIMTPSIALCTIVVLAIATVDQRASGIKTILPVGLLLCLALILVAVGFGGGPVPRATLL